MKTLQHPQIIRDLMVVAFKLDNRPDLRSDQKIGKLTDLARKFRSGWPFGTNNKWADYGHSPSQSEYRNFLESFTAQLADRCNRLELARNGRNIGKFDSLEGDAAKKHSTADKKPEVIIEIKKA